jgi:hypothetical protein
MQVDCGLTISALPMKALRERSADMARRVWVGTARLASGTPSFLVISFCMEISPRLVSTRMDPTPEMFPAICTNRVRRHYFSSRAGSWD